MRTEGEGTTNPGPGKIYFNEGEEVVLEAIPDIGYEFVGWFGDVLEKDRKLSLEIDNDKSITAAFEKEEETGNNVILFVVIVMGIIGLGTILVYSKFLRPS